MDPVSVSGTSTFSYVYIRAHEFCMLFQSHENRGLIYFTDNA